MQAVIDLDSVLEANWTAGNTDGITPLITDNLQTPWESLDFGAKDHLYVKYDTEVIDTGMYALDFFHRVACTVEVMTAKTGATQGGRAHFKKLMDETARIIKANPRLSDYVHMITRGTRARFNKDRGIFIGSVEVEFIRVLQS
jgi:hypothetical protein